MARRQFIEELTPMGFGKYKGMTPNEIIDGGDMGYLVWLYEQKSNQFSAWLTIRIKEWADENPEKYEKIKSKCGAETAESPEKVLAHRFGDISEKRKAMWGSW